MKSNIALQSLNIGSSETIELNKLSIPIDNCGGSSIVSQKYTQSQSFIRQMNSEVTARVGGEVPIAAWLKVVGELQIKYGFENGQIDNKILEYQMSAEPRTSVLYTISWREVWQKGDADLVYGSTNIKVPFRAKSDLVYSIESRKIECK